MTGLARVPKDVRTVYLGQFTHAHANEIAAQLEDRAIVYWYKSPSVLSRIWDPGIHLFVDRTQLDAARSIVESVLARP
jgi:hypothetical protein